MMKHMIRVLCLSCVMMLHMSTVSAREYLLIATQEEAMVSIPCRFYHLNSTQPDLMMVAEIAPQKGIRLVEAYPQQRKVAIWRYEEDKTGSLVIVDVDRPEDRRTVPLPFEPVFGGYFMTGPEGDSLFVAWRLSKIQDQRSYSLYAYSLRSDRAEPIQSAQWDTAIINGINRLRRGGGILLNVMIDPASGDISHFAGEAIKTPLLLRLDAATLQAFTRVETRATQQIWGNNEHTTVLGAREQGEERKYFFVYIYDKRLQQWNQLTVEGVYSHIQLFDPWLLIQQGFEDKRRSHAPSILTGKYTFYHLESHEQFEWQADSDTEVLGIWENTILYRQEDELFEADIVATKMEETRLLAKDPAIRDVHWACIDAEK